MSVNEAGWDDNDVGPLGRVPARSPHVVARRLGAEQVVLNTQTEAFFTLNAVGARVWDLVDGQRSVAAIVRALLLTYDVAEATLAADVAALLEDLAANHLVVWMWAAGPR